MVGAVDQEAAHPQPQRHRWFDRWLGARGEPLRRIVHEVAGAIEQHEHAEPPRQRRLRAADKASRDAVIETIASNLAYAVLLSPETGRLAVLTGNNSKRIARYSSPATGKALRDRLNTAAALGIADHQAPSLARREAPSMAPTAAFTATVRAAGVSLSDFGRIEREEVILLSRKSTDDEHPSGPEREMLDYPETCTTTALRGSVRAVNSFLEGADIGFLKDGLGPVDPHSRAMRRYFVQRDPSAAPQMDQGGRLYGGFWQNLPRVRRPSIRIEGEPVTVLDYSSMFPRLAYAVVRVTPPDGDLYAIPGLEEHRPAVKLLMNAMFFDGHARSTWPKSAEVPQPERWKVAEMRRAILVHHPHLRPLFGQEVGHSLMHLESRIMMAVLEELTSRRIIGLGLHDGLVVPSSRASEVGRIMRDTALDITSATLPVSTRAA